MASDQEKFMSWLEREQQRKNDEALKRMAELEALAEPSGFPKMGVECIGGPLDGHAARTALEKFGRPHAAWFFCPAFRVHVNAAGERVEFVHRYTRQPDGSFVHDGVHATTKVSA